VQSLDSAIILIVVGTTIIIGFAGYRLSKTFTGYIFANKTLGPWILAFSIMATYFSAASFLGGGGATYLYNLGFGAWLTAWHVIGVVILWIVVAKRLFNYVSEYKVMSIPEFIEHRYRSKLARVIAVTVMIFLFIFYLVSVYKGGAIIISTILGIDIQLALLVLAIPVIIYIVIGGLRAAAINNLFLGLLMLIAATFTFSYIMSYVGGPIKGLEMLSQINILDRYPGTLWLKLNGMGPPPVVEKIWWFH
jgi:sodium/pantothenate symporter